MFRVLRSDTHHFSPPTPPAEEKKKGKENFWFLLPRPQGEKRILGASQDLERFVLKMRKVYSSCKERTRRATSSVRFNPEPPRAPRVRLVEIRILLKIHSNFVQYTPKINERSEYNFRRVRDSNSRWVSPHALSKRAH